MYLIYWLINQKAKETYIGFTDNLKERLNQHRNKRVKSTKNFNNFSCVILEKVSTREIAREREKYWKSHAGRKKLKNIFNKLKDNNKI